jgi:hypothetical protein
MALDKDCCIMALHQLPVDHAWHCPDDQTVDEMTSITHQLNHISNTCDV